MSRIAGALNTYRVDSAANDHASVVISSDIADICSLVKARDLVEFALLSINRRVIAIDEK